ncbi:MAG TPA: shikimate kinase [Candidatus Aminicenantes bacterium]|nr:shikimate kinase [Candidatus Aminicenantes bacterium]
MKLLAVAGAPVLHSRSPRIFERLFAGQGREAAFIRLSAGSAGEAAAAAAAMGLAGFNVTAPLKSAVLPHLHRIQPEARAVEAVNCVVVRGGRWTGHNTDIPGSARALASKGIEVAGKRVAVLGAGGAARAAALGAVRSGAAAVVLMNRTPERAEAAARRLGCAWALLKEMPDVLGRSDILVSCLSGAETPVRRSWLRRGLAVLDANYRDSPLAGEAAEAGCVVVDGTEWLLHQAFLSFRLFTGRDASPAARAEAREALQAEEERPRRNLGLIGFMGSGKSALGALLAERTGFSLVDTDAVIESAAGMTVADIFKTRGEGYFRRREKALLAARLPGARRTVFAFGGGTVLDGENRALIRRSCRTVWLWASPRTASRRVEPASRPLLEGDGDGRRAEELFRSRLPLYARLSDLVVSTESATPEEAARRIQHECETG